MSAPCAADHGDADRNAVAGLRGVSHYYRNTAALLDVDVDIPAGRLVGLIGPDGVGKSTLLALSAGVRSVQQGEVRVLGGDMRHAASRRRICPRIAYMPQGLGKNLYPSLSIDENLDFFGRLFGQPAAARAARVDMLLAATGLTPFRGRPAGKLSGGMKQKLGLCCALLHDPELLILDEPTTGVDPLSRRQFWRLIAQIRARGCGLSVLVATAYMDEAEDFDWLIAMDAGRVLACGSPAALRERTGSADLDAAFVSLLPPRRRERGLRGPAAPPAPDARGRGEAPLAIEASGLSRRFGDFTAVDRVSFRIRRGEIFGFLGSNGCGKTTTMKMLTGLLPASEGEARLFGKAVDPKDLETRKRVGFMSQTFSLYGELTVAQNLRLHARLFHLSARQRRRRVDELFDQFGLRDRADELAADLPLGIRQRLSLAVAMIHRPAVLILDEPTSGVDPLARDRFWELLLDLSRRQGVTIFISTHFMNEAERCDRVSLMHAGTVLASGRPAELIERSGGDSLEQAFIYFLEGASDDPPPATTTTPTAELFGAAARPCTGRAGAALGRLLGYARRETQELLRDPVRLAFAAVGSALLMLVLGYGINMDVEDIAFAVLDRDRTPESRAYSENLAGSRYFVERPPIRDMAALERRMRDGELSLALEIGPGFGRALRRGQTPQIAAWIDASMTFRAETVNGYLHGLHADYLARQARSEPAVRAPPPAPALEIRYRYNQDFKSLYATVPATIPLLLALVPSILMALAVVREKELGSIVNFYATPGGRLEFLLGKQLPYIAVSMLNFAMLMALAVWFFQIPFKGGLWTLTLAALLYVAAMTAWGMLISTFTRSQTAAIFGTAIATMMPATQFSGLIDPVSSLEGGAALIGKLFPTTYFMIISRGTFTKALGLADLYRYHLALALFFPALLALSALLLRKQER